MSGTRPVREVVEFAAPVVPVATKPADATMRLECLKLAAGLAVAGATTASVVTAAEAFAAFVMPPEPAK